MIIKSKVARQPAPLQNASTQGVHIHIPHRGTIPQPREHKPVSLPIRPHRPDEQSQFGRHWPVFLISRTNAWTLHSGAVGLGCPKERATPLPPRPLRATHPTRSILQRTCGIIVCSHVLARFSTFICLSVSWLFTALITSSSAPAALRMYSSSCRGPSSPARATPLVETHSIIHCASNAKLEQISRSKTEATRGARLGSGCTTRGQARRSWRIAN